MNILYLHRTQAKGVEGVHINEIVKAFRKLGHQVDIVSPVDEHQPSAAPGEKPAMVPGWRKRLFRLISRNLPELVFELVEIAYNLHALRRVRQRFGSGTADMIFERYAIFSLVGARLARRWNRPLIVEINYTSCSPLVRRRSWILKPLARRIDQYIFDRATGFAAVSSRLKQHLIGVYGIPAEKIIVLPNAADPEVFDVTRVAARTLPAANAKVIGFVGGFYPWHGLDLLLRAFTIVAPRVPEAQLLLIGDGPMMPEIRQHIRDSGLESRATLTGQVPHHELPGYIAGFYIGVMPDSNDYGSPMKIFEYMAMGKPVVVPDYPPLLDVVDDGSEGRVFRAQNVHEMADCLEMLLTDTGAYRRMAAQARQKIVTRHNWTDNARAILKLCDEKRT